MCAVLCFSLFRLFFFLCPSHSPHLPITPTPVPFAPFFFFFFCPCGNNDQKGRFFSFFFFFFCCFSCVFCSFSVFFFAAFGGGVLYTHCWRFPPLGGRDRGLAPPPRPLIFFFFGFCFSRPESGGGVGCICLFFIVRFFFLFALFDGNSFVFFHLHVWWGPPPKRWIDPPLPRRIGLRLDHRRNCCFPQRPSNPMVFLKQNYNTKKN